SVLFVIDELDEKHTTLDILTYNTHLFYNLIVGPEYQDDVRTRGIIHMLQESSFDLVGLTEVWADSTKKNFIESLQNKFPYYAYEDLSPIRVGDGLLLLSKYPLSDYQFVPFDDLVDVDSASRKGILTVKVD